MLPYQKRRTAARQKRVMSEIDIAREIQKQRPEKPWDECIVEARRELGHYW